DVYEVAVARERPSRASAFRPRSARSGRAEARTQTGGHGTIDAPRFRVAVAASHRPGASEQSSELPVAACHTCSGRESGCPGRHLSREQAHQVASDTWERTLEIVQRR